MKKTPLLWIFPALAITLALVLSGCSDQHEKPYFVYMPDMVYSPAFKAQEEGGVRLPPKGTVPRGYSAVGYASNEVDSFYSIPDQETAGRVLRNPLRRTEAVMKRGQVVFNNTCAACHGVSAEGDGGVVAHGYPRPPTLVGADAKARAWADGELFHIITKGRGIMPPYATQIKPKDRWAVVHYVRAMQRATQPTQEDLKAYQAETQ